MKNLCFSKMRLLRLMLLFVGLTCGFNASASTPNWVLSIWDREGVDVATIALGAEPNVTFEDNLVTVTNNIGDQLFFNLPDLWKFTYDHPTSINDIAANDATSMQCDGNSIVFNNLKAGANIAVYAANGTLVMNKRVAADGEYAFSLSNLSQGVYLVNVNGLTFKIAKK